MIERLVELVLDESKWMPAALLLSLLAAAAWILRRRDQPRRALTLSALNLLYGCTIGIMACGHLLAVTIKAARGALPASLGLMLALGLLLAVPAAWLVVNARSLARGSEAAARRSVAINAGLGLCLLALGPFNFPLAAPAGLNVAYRYHVRPAVGWSIVAVTAVAYVGLLVGSLVFLASGGSFEDFQGL